MDAVIDRRVMLTVVGILQQRGETIDGKTHFNGIVMSSPDDGYTIELKYKDITVIVSFHNVMRWEGGTPSQRDELKRLFLAISRGDY